MLDVREVYKIQAESNIVGVQSLIGSVTFEEYINQCRLFIAENLPKDYNSGEWDREKKAQVYLDTITSYVDKHKVMVKGYVTGDGVLDLDTGLAVFDKYLFGLWRYLFASNGVRFLASTPGIDFRFFLVGHESLSAGL